MRKNGRIDSGQAHTKKKVWKKLRLIHQFRYLPVLCLVSLRLLESTSISQTDTTEYQISTRIDYWKKTTFNRLITNGNCWSCFTDRIWFNSECITKGMIYKRNTELQLISQAMFVENKSINIGYDFIKEDCRLIHNTNETHPEIERLFSICD